MHRAQKFTEAKWNSIMLRSMWNRKRLFLGNNGGDNVSDVWKRIFETGKNQSNDEGSEGDGVELEKRWVMRLDK